MAIALVMLSVFCIFSFAEAKDYGHYNLKHDLKRIITVSDTTSEKQTSIHLDSLDQILTDLSSHARSYPPTFDTSKDRERAVEDVKTLSVLLDVLVNGPNPHPKLLLRAGFLNSMGHNLDIPGTAEKAHSNFQRLLTISPSDPHVNYHYGTFLAGTAKPREALPYLEKAFAAGVRDAAYGLGMTYLVLGDKHKAIEHLEAYRQHRPQDDVVAKLIDDIRNGRFEIKWSRVTEGSSR